MLPPPVPGSGALPGAGPATDPGPRRRRGTILGVSAGLLGGGLVGLAMTVPSFTSAASEDTGDDVVVAFQDSGTSTDSDTGSDTGTGSEVDGERPEAGTRLRELLQPLVDDGTISAAQADAVTDHLVEQRPDRHHHRGHRPGLDGEVVAGLIGIDATELRDALRDGQSIADVAEANGVDPQTIVDALVAEVGEHLDLSVENGRLTEDEAAERLEAMTERITARVNGERPARR